MSVPDEQLDGYINRRELVCICRENIDPHPLQAFLLGYSPALLLVHYVRDFRPDGQLILRRNYITSIRCRPTDAFQQRILAEKGLLEEIDFNFKAQLASFSSALTSQPPQSLVIIEDESVDEPMFWIGRFIDADQDTVRIHEFSGVANWDDELTEIVEETITCCQLNSNYINCYANYFQTQPPPPPLM